MRKYGPIICDPYSREAKDLVGKVVIVGDTFGGINDGKGKEGILAFLGEFGFTIGAIDEKPMPFIREVIEVEPFYRPYKNVDELIKDFKARFMSKTIGEAYMPLIWVDNGDRHLITGFDHEDCILIANEWYMLAEAFAVCRYLDGSPFGKEYKPEIKAEEIYASGSIEGSTWMFVKEEKE